MSKYDEFDLDVQNLKGNEGGSQEKSISISISTIITGSVLTGCTTNDCSKGCTDGYSASCIRSQCPPC